MRVCNQCGRIVRMADYSMEPPRPWCTDPSGSFCAEYVLLCCAQTGVSIIDYVNAVRNRLRRAAPTAESI
jgi:hypothetical protein